MLRAPRCSATGAAVPPFALSVPAAPFGCLSIQLEMGKWVRHMDKEHPLPHRIVGDAHTVFGVGVLDARLHGGVIVRLWTIPVSVLPPSGAGYGRDAAAIVRRGWASVPAAQRRNARRPDKIALPR